MMVVDCKYITVHRLIFASDFIHIHSFRIPINEVTSLIHFGRRQESVNQADRMVRVAWLEITVI